MDPCRKDLVAPLGKERSVRCEDRFEAPLARKTKKHGKCGMGQRLAHQMKVKIFGQPPKLSENMDELGFGHPFRRAPMPVAKGAMQIAEIRDLDVSLAVPHGLLLSSRTKCPLRPLYHKELRFARQSRRRQKATPTVF